MTTTVSFIIVLGILVFVHELGHFLVAKAMGVGVDRFSIGFPPKMFGFRRGETEYCVSWIPLGGYVKLRGEDPEEDLDWDDPKMYSSRPPRQRAGIVIAGPVMNLVLSFILMSAVFLVGMSIPAFFEDPAIVGWIVPGSAGDKAGYQVGDVIVAFGDDQVEKWEDLFEAAAMQTNETFSARVLRNDHVVELPMNLEDMKGEEGLGVLPVMEPVVGRIAPGYPAQAAGLKPGDRILSVGGLPVNHWNEMARIIHGSPGKSITIGLERDGQTMRLDVTPQTDEKTGHGLIGISPESRTVSRRYPFFEAVARGVERNVELIKLTFRFLLDLVTFKASIKMLGGPIMIFQVTGEAARAGLSRFIEFMAFLSLQLGILNLLPIPVLDGGHLFFLGWEGIRGKPLDIRHREIAQRVGFLVLLLLIIVVSYNDILRLLSGR
ncbi:MAG: RIP metalloprotease RseP [bacterium]|nr:MAG: RIP metalloprotease RseP [bacterium]